MARWGSWPSKAAMWADRLDCPRCGAQAGEACQTKSGREAGYPHGGRELRAEARPTRPAPRSPGGLPYPEKLYARMAAEDKARAERRSQGGPRLRLAQLQVR